MSWRLATALALSTGCGPGAGGEVSEAPVDPAPEDSGLPPFHRGDLSYTRMPRDEDVRCRDADRDGYADPDLCVIHAEAPGWIRTNSPDDCDDTNPDIHPEAGDTPGDGVDSDCTGEDACGEVVYEWTTFTGKDGGLQMAEFCKGGPVEVRSRVSITGLPSSALTRLSCVCRASGLDLDDSPQVGNLRGLEAMCLSEGLHLVNNQSLVSVEGLCKPTGRLGYLTVWDNPLLADLDGLQRLSSVGSISMGRSGLTSLHGLENLLTVEGDLSVGFGLHLRDLSELGGLQHVAGHLEIESESLESLQGLNNLRSAGDLSIRAPIASLEGLDSLADVGTLDVTGVAASSLAGLDALTVVENRMYLDSNPNLESLDGLGALATVGEGLEITGNPALLDLDGLTSLRGIRGDLAIRSNDSLVDIGALANLEYIDGDLLVGENPALSTEHVEAVVEAIGLENINGDVWIWDNAP